MAQGRGSRLCPDHSALDVGYFDEDLRDSRVFAPIPDVVHDLPPRFSETERFRQGVQGRWFQVSERRCRFSEGCTDASWRRGPEASLAAYGVAGPDSGHAAYRA